MLGSDVLTDCHGVYKLYFLRFYAVTTAFDSCQSHMLYCGPHCTSTAAKEHRATLLYFESHCNINIF